jgi:hypothetical protein
MRRHLPIRLRRLNRRNSASRPNSLRSSAWTAEVGLAQVTSRSMDALPKIVQLTWPFTTNPSARLSSALPSLVGEPSRLSLKGGAADGGTWVGRALSQRHVLCELATRSRRLPFHQFTSIPAHSGKKKPDRKFPPVDGTGNGKKNSLPMNVNGRTLVRGSTSGPGPSL